MSKIRFEVSDEEMSEAVVRVYGMKDGELVDEYNFLSNNLQGEPTQEEVDANRAGYLVLGLVLNEFKRRNMQFAFKIG